MSIIYCCQKGCTRTTRENALEYWTYCEKCRKIYCPEHTTRFHIMQSNCVEQRGQPHIMKEFPKIIRHRVGYNITKIHDRDGTGSIVTET